MHESSQARWREASATVLGLALIAVSTLAAGAEDLVPMPAARVSSGVSLPLAATGPMAPQSAAKSDGGLVKMGPTEACVEQRPITEVDTNIGVKDGVNEPGGRRRGLPSRQHTSGLDDANSPVGDALLLLGGPRLVLWSSLLRGNQPGTPRILSSLFAGSATAGLQRPVSSARYPPLPYLMVAEPPQECVSTLGQYRPGDCVPFQWNYPYFSPCAPRHSDGR